MIIVSKEAEPRLIEYLKSLDDVQLFGPLKTVGKGIACHPDVLYCKLDAAEDAPVFKGDETKLGSVYPADCRYNAVVLRDYIIHKQGFTDELLLKTIRTQTEDSVAPQSSVKKISAGQHQRLYINVPQAYTKCNIVAVDDYHIITSDVGIAKAVDAVNTAENINLISQEGSSKKLHCLLISPKQINLSGFQYGFIGGCSGRVGNKIIFNGNLGAHSDFDRISQFIKACGFELVYFKDWPLTDIGSIIEMS